MTNDSLGGGANTRYFDSMPNVMNTLLLEGVLPLHAGFVREVALESWVFWPIMVSFVALSSMLLMNMLVGVLVEVVSAIASTEREGITVMSLATDLRASMANLNIDAECPLTRDEIETTICDSDVALIVGQAGSDIVTLADMMHVVFDDLADEQGNISFSDFVETVLSLRGTNPAKVKDVKAQLRAIKVAIKETEVAIRGAVFDEVEEIRKELHHFTKEYREEHQDDEKNALESDE
mmetsp:Transcript_37249/g.119211  ORF Transcript_37249/g.119211 Transcript_37249/m.119211 type:complete len:236 (+) Transcript_37249:413-1120(+)